MRPNPPVDAVTEAWWDATRDKKLMVQTCGSCGNAQLYPRPLCTSCHSTDVSLTESSGRGVVWSFTEIQRSGVEWMTAPYTVAIVRLSEGAQMLTNLTEPAGCDTAVEVVWEPLEDGRHLPLFKPE